MLLLFLLFRRIAEPTPFPPPFFPLLGISSFWKFNRHHPSGTGKEPMTPREEKVFDWVISSDLFPLNDPDTPINHRPSGGRSSPDIFAPSYLALPCSWEVFQDLDSGRLPILLSDPFSPVFCLNKRPPSFNLQKSRGDDFAFYFDSYSPFTEEYSYLSFSSATSLFSAVNAATFSIHFGRVKPNLKPDGLLKWKKRLMKDVRLCLLLIEGMKIVRLTSPLPDGPRLSSPKSRLRHGRGDFLFSLLNPINLSILSFVMSLALPPLLTSLTVPLPGNRLRSLPQLEIPLFCLPAKGFGQQSQRLLVLAPSSHVP